MTYPIIELAFWNPGDPGSAAIDSLLADRSVPLSRHGLTGIASVYARETGATLHDEHRYWATELGVRSLAADGALTEVVPILEGAGIPFFVAKGPVIAYRDYADPSMRPYCDLDIYVHEARADEARSLLAQHGYSMVDHAIGVLGGLAHEVQGGRFGAVVEVHGHPIDNLHRRHLPPVSAFLEHVERVELCGVSVPVLNPAADLALQAIHMAAGHRYAKVILLRDMALALPRAAGRVPLPGVSAYVAAAGAILSGLGRPVPATSGSGVLHRPLIRRLLGSDPVTWDEYRASMVNVLAFANQRSWRVAAQVALRAARGSIPASDRRVGVRVGTGRFSAPVPVLQATSGHGGGQGGSS
jgi:hypothetical protein